MARSNKSSKAPQEELSALEYTRRSGLTLDWVYKQARLGRIPGAYRVDGEWRIPAQAVQQPAKASA